MTTSSGVRPYSYVGPYPFSGSGLGKVGYSGIFFEQAMFVLTAESEIYSSGAPRQFTKYINKGASVSSDFEPSPTGLNLVRANIHFKDYITDMRARFSGLFAYIATEDSPYYQNELLLQYFQNHTGDNPSGSVGNWLHSLTNLAEEGALYDIDLREVQFQPFVRISKYRNTLSSGIVDIPTTPIAPMFCTTDGGLITVSERDLGHIAQTDENALFAYCAAAASYMVVHGDMIEAQNSKIYLTWTSGNLLSSVTGNCDQASERILNEEINRGYGFFTLPTNIPVDTGIYGVQLFNTNPLISGIYVPVSGIDCFWPRREEIITSGYQRATHNGGVTGQMFTSGLHIIDAAFAQHSASGAVIMSPINGKKLWYKFADLQSWSTTNTGPFSWSSLGQPALPIAGLNNSLVFFKTITSDINPDIILADRRFVFTMYTATNLDFLDGFETSYAMVAPASPPSVDKFFFIYNHTPPSGVNLSNYYAIAECVGLSSGPEFYVFDANLENIAAWDTNGNIGGSPICMINGHLYGFDNTQTGSSGATFLWQHIVLGDPAGSFPPSPSSPITIDNDTDTWEVRDTYFDNTNGMAEIFEPINPTNFGFGGIPYTIDPRGTNLDNGDGSIFIKFNAKMKGETILKTFLGRIKEDTIEGIDVLSIFEFIPLENGIPGWIYNI